MIGRLALAAALAGAALATPASAGAEVCTSDAGLTVGGCVHVVCIKLCVTQIEIDPQCSIDRPVPMPVYSACSRIDQQLIQIGG